MSDGGFGEAGDDAIELIAFDLGRNFVIQGAGGLANEEVKAAAMQLDAKMMALAEAVTGSKA